MTMPLEKYLTVTDFGELNDIYIAEAVRLGEIVIADALAAAEIAPDEVDLVISTTVTGISAPSIEGRISSELGFRPDVKRVPMFGLGCVAGAAGIARLADYLCGHPDQIAVLLSVELCSLTLPHNDSSAGSVIASLLFGDGAAAVVAVGADRAARTRAQGPRVLDSRSHLYPDTERALGMDLRSEGLRVVLDPQVVQLTEKYLGDDIRTFLSDHELTVEDVAAWVLHPGGPKIIEALESDLTLSAKAFQLSWQSLAQVGNLSSSSVLHILRDTLQQRRPPAGTPGLVVGMGPGFCSELVLVSW